MNHHDVNRIVLTGRVYEAPDMRFAAHGEPYTTFLLACVARHKSKDEQQPDLFWLRANGERLAALCNDLLPNTRVLVEGRLQTRADDTLNEMAWYAYEVRVQRLIILQSPPDWFGAAVLLPRSPNPAPSTVIAERETCSIP